MPKIYIWIKSINKNSLSIWGPICCESSLKFKFLSMRAGNLLSVNFQLFAKIMILSTDSYLSYITGVERRRNLWLLLVLELVEIGGPSMDPGPYFVLFYHNHHPWKVICCVNDYFSLKLLFFGLTLHEFVHSSNSSSASLTE